MIFEVLLILPLYIGIFVICFRFKHVIKAMSEIDELLNVSLPDTNERGEEEENGREILINVINQGKGNLLPGKYPWTVVRIKVFDADIDKLKSHFVQAETNLKKERTGKAMSKHVVNLYSTGVSKIVKIDNIDQLREDIDEDPIIRDSMAEVGALLVETFGRYLAPLLVLAHTANRSEGFLENILGNFENERDSDHTLVGDSSEK